MLVILGLNRTCVCCSYLKYCLCQEHMLETKILLVLTWGHLEKAIPWKTVLCIVILIVIIEILFQCIILSRRFYSKYQDKGVYFIV